MPFIGLIILIVVLCCVAAYCPMPKPLQVGLWVAAAIVVLIIVLSLLGADGGYVRVWRP